MATHFSRPSPQCNGYLGIVLREPGRNTPVRAVNGHCLIAAIDWLGLSSRANRLLVTSQETSYMLNPQKTLEREALLKRVRELDAKSRSLSAICGKVRLGCGSRRRAWRRSSRMGTRAQNLHENLFSDGSETRLPSWDHT
jgi:hypothetical protein